MILGSAAVEPVVVLAAFQIASMSAFCLLSVLRSLATATCAAARAAGVLAFFSREVKILGVYPEGTRSLDEFVHRGRTGVARLSRECGVPVIPVGVIGTVDVQPVNSNVMRPFKTVTIRFGAPMQMDPPEDPAHPLENHDHTECRAFTDQLMREIARLSEREYVDEYVPSRSASRPAAA